MYRTVPIIIVIILSIVLSKITFGNEMLRVGVYQNSPKVFLDENNQPQGFFVDLMDEIAQHEGWQVEYVFGSWSDNLERLENEEIDILLDVAYTDERAKRFKFNNIFAVDGWLEVFALEGCQIGSVLDMENKTIAVLEDSRQDKLVRRLFNKKLRIKVELRSYKDYPQTVNALLKKEADAIVASRFFYFSSERPENVLPTSVIFGLSQAYFAFPKTIDDGIISAVDKHLKSFKNNPTSIYYRSLKKWFKKPQDKIPGQYLLWIIVISSCLLILAVLFVYFLKLQVKNKTAELKRKNLELQNLYTQSQKAEMELTKFSFMVENARQEVYLVYPSGKLAYVNSATSKNLGYTKEELLQGGVNLFDPNYGNKFQEHFAELKKSEMPAFETVHFTKDGRKLSKRMKSFYLRIGSEEMVCGFAEDITEFKKAQKALFDSNKLFQSLAEMAPVGIFRTKPDGYTTFVNPKWCSLSGLSFEQALGEGWIRAVHPDDKDRVMIQWKQKTRKREKSESEYRFLKPDGTVVWVLGDANPEINEGEVAGYIGTITDITERKVAELLLKEKAKEIEAQNEEYKQLNQELEIAKEKAEESDRLKTAFLANMSHEIRTPMNAICGFSRLLGKQNINQQQKNHYIDIVNSNSQQLLGIISDIIDISKIESGAATFNKKVFSVNELIDDILNTFKDIIQQKGLKISCKKGLPNPKSFIESDEVKLKQVISNLLVNATKHTQEGEVEFGYVLKGDKLVFHVKDTGIGIPEDMQELIFDRFYQVDDANISSRRGTGLGLPISKAYVNILGGDIWVNSNLGNGSTFTFTIPYIQAKEDAPEERNQEVSQIANWQGKSILIAEDDLPNYQYLKEILSDTGATVLHVDNGRDAIRVACEDRNIDLVLMDIKMPELDGFSAAKKIREHRKDLPIIAQTAYAFPDDERKAIDVGCNSFITKPINDRTLLSVLSKYLA
ncbi:MAG: PAS domain S-box protein [Bacteroidales bacterium]